MMSSDDGGSGNNYYANYEYVHDDADAQLVLKSDIRPLDVLVGRGYFRHAGNVRFLRIVADRKEEYKTERTCDAKDRIANEVVELVHDPTYLSGAEDGFGPAAAAGQLLPGRFLQLESGDIKEPTSVWRPISGKAVNDKVKMALRQKARDKAARAKAKAASTVRVSSESNSSNSDYLSQKMQSKQEGKRRLGEGGAVSQEEGNFGGDEQLLPLSEYFDGVVDGDDHLFFDGLNLEDEGEDLEIVQGEHDTNSVSGGTKIGIANQRAPSNGSGDSLGHPLPSAVPEPASTQNEEMLRTRQRLLENLQFALKRVQMQSSEHQAAAAPGLEGIGRELCLRFAGVEPDLFQRASMGTSSNASTSPVASSSNGGPSQNPRKRTGMVGSVQNGSTSTSPSFSAASSPSPGLGGGTASLSDRLRDAGLPISLCTVITSFLGATDPNTSDRYLSFADAAADLGRMIADPDRYLFDPPMDRHHGTLHFIPNRLYGRAEAWAKVKLSFDKIIVTQEESHGFLMISGPPGSGKTALVEKLRDPLAERRGMVVWIKFDSQQQEYPMINICRGFDEYFQSLLRGDSALLQEIGGAIKESLGVNMTVLRDLIPTLGTVVGGWPESHYNTEGRETYNLILHCIKKLVNAIAQPSHPVVVLFDDLQWSDDASNEIIRMLVTDESSRAAMFIGCYRDNEVDANHPVSQGIGAILMALVPLAIVSLGNLDRESVNDLCSDVLHLSPRLTRPLAEALHSKTSGNPMFVRQLMCSLSEEGLLYYSASERRWRWDINGIRIKAVADNAVDLLIVMMRSYSPELRWLLQIASCLGFRFDVTAIALLASASEEMALADGSSISTHIQAAVADGLLIEESAGVYHFSHDQIWLAAYSLTPPADRNSLHLRIGRQLRKKASSGDTDDADGDAFLFTVVDQLKRGIEAVQDHVEEVEIAKLNLRAGEKALSAFLFQPAATYLLQGCSLLRPEDWDTQYKLCVRLYLAYAEVRLAQGDNDGALLSVAPVLTNARGHANDMLRARETQIRANIAQAKFQEALQNSSTILGELDIDVSKIDPAAIQSELIKTLALLNPGDITGQSLLRSLLSKPTSTDLRQIGRIRILFYSTRAAYAVKPALMLFIILRMSQLVFLDDEITAESSYALANLSLALTCLGMHDASYLSSKLALALLDRFDHKYSNMVTFLLNSSILQYRQPMQACLESQRQAYRGFVSVGDRDFARMSTNQISQISIMAPERGKMLDDVEREIRQVLTEFSTQYEDSKSLLIMSVMYLQTLLNLKEESPPAGIDDDPTILTGSAMDQEEYLKICEEKGLRDYFRHFYGCRLYLAYLFRRHSLAEDTVKACAELESSKFCSSTEIVVETFYMGLIAADAIQRRKGAESSAADIERWQKMADDSLNSLTTWAKEGSEWNFLHKVALLRAEIAVANGDYDTAISFYQGAIAKSSYVNEEALSCERAGLFYFAQGEMEEGKLCLSRAVSLYRAWGARRKALDVLQLMGSWGS